MLVQEMIKREFGRRRDWAAKWETDVEAARADLEVREEEGYDEEKDE